MKKIAFIMAIAVLLSFSGCQSKEPGASSEINESDISSQIAEAYDGYLENIYDVYDIIGSDSTFYDAMRYNDIDKKADLILKDLVTTRELEAGAISIYEMWKDELEYSLSEIEKVLSKEKFEKLLTSQRDWEKYVQSTLSCDKDIMTDENGGFASELWFKFPLERAKLYRARTIKIKYLHYLVESEMYDSESQYKSLTFKNKA
ncbi:MAG: DUF1311 domain-containing protein [Ruminococcaceae bacterium]|nr:DUF1311 domain-containing protein [Oscillospiraceae bacterium]